MISRTHFAAATFLAVGATAIAHPAFAQGPAGSAPTVNGESLTKTTQANGPAEQFGEKGELAISSDAAISVSNTSLSGVSGSTTQVTFAPAVDYFVIRSLSIGGTVLLNYSSDGAGHSTKFGIGPRVGYNFAFSDLISLWPKVGFSIAHTSQSTDVTVATGPTPTTTTAQSSNTGIALNLFVPLMFHPAPHFFAGFGPYLDTDLSGDAKATTIGAKLTIGGWLGL